MLNKSRRWKMSLVRNFLLRALIRCALSCMFLLWLILENFLEQSVCLWFESGPIRVRKQCYYYVPELAKYSAFFLKWHWKLITGQLSFSPFLNPNEVPNKIEVFKKPQVTCNFQVSNYIYLPCKIGYFNVFKTLEKPEIFVVNFENRIAKIFLRRLLVLIRQSARVWLQDAIPLLNCQYLRFFTSLP